MGTATDWQTRMERTLSEFDIVIFNPRRDDWDTSWVQSKDNPQFREQVEWELDALERANIIAVYFEPGSKSPISLLEFGMFGDGFARMIVCCPEGFWRKGNVDIVCEYRGIEQVDTLDQLIACVKKAVQ